MKNHITSLFIMICFSTSIISQIKHDYTWIFGNGPNNSNTIDFNTNPISVFSENRDMDIYISNACVSDTSGNLLFYTNGCRIADATHKTMANGDSLNIGMVYENRCGVGESGYSAGNQSCLILPVPDSAYLFYLFHKRIIILSSPSVEIITDKLYTTTVDTRLNNGLGAVVLKNQIVLNDSLTAGELTATKHLNNKDWWIISPQFRNDKYYKLLFTHNGIVEILEQQIGFPISKLGQGRGQGIFTPDGTKYIRYNPVEDLFIFDFDRSTGELSNFQNIIIEDDANIGGVAVSSNSRFVYVSSLNYIYQFDLWASDIATTKITVATYDGYTSPFAATFWQAQLGPDCRIYINAPNGIDVMHVIKYPNRKGMACEVQQHGVQFPTSHGISMPHFPNYRLGTPYPFCDSSLTLITPLFEIPALQAFELSPNPAQTEVTLRFEPAAFQQAVFSLFDMLGRELMRQEVNGYSGEQLIDVSLLSDGLYFYQIAEQGKLLGSGKLMKQ